MDTRSKTLEIMRRIGAAKPERIRITGILESPELGLLTLTLPGDSSDSSAAILSLLGAQNINIRFISKHDDSSGKTVLSLAVEQAFLPAALDLLYASKEGLEVTGITSHPRVKVVSLYPHKGRARVAERLFTTLRLHGIEPLAANNASSVISCVLRAEQLHSALACLEDAFELP